MVSVTNPAGRVSAWKYLADGKLDMQTLGNRAWEKYVYDAVGALSGTMGYNPKGRVLTEYGSFTNDDLGRLTGQKAITPGKPTTTGANIWGYTPTGQLTSDGFMPNNGAAQAKAATFDAVGNPTTFVRELAGYTDGTFTRHYDANNQWDGYLDSRDSLVYNRVGNVANAATLFAYDDKGNPTIYKGDALSYDSLNRLTHYADKLSAGYRSDGRRAWKEVNGVRTYFLYAGGQLLAELDESGTLISSYTWGPTGLLSRTNLQTNREVWYLYDPQGNVAQRLDGAGQVLSSDQYDAWGNLLSGGDPTDPCGYRAQVGYYTDHETALILCGHRYYDPVAGRWLTRDPIGVAGGMNLYGYCGGDPVSGIDPEGYWSGVDDAVFLIGGALVGIAAQAISDYVSGEKPSWEKYAGAALGGAVSGEVLLYAGPVVAGMAGSAVSNGATQLLNMKYDSSNKKSFDYGDFVGDTVIGGLTGLIGGSKIPGITTGRNSFNAIFKQMTTKFANKTISKVSVQTAMKMFVGRSVDKALFEGMIAPPLSKSLYDGLYNTAFDALNRIAPSVWCEN